MFRTIVLIFLFVSTLLSGQKLYKGDISNAQLKELMNRGAHLIDIRTPPEWSHLGIVPSSKLMTFFNERGAYNLNGFISKLKAQGIKESDNVIIICRSGNRSVHTSNMLTLKGFKNVYNVTKGIKGWIRQGEKVQRKF